MFRRLHRGLVAACCLVSAPAQAHVTLEQPSARADTSYKAVLRVPHGCEGAATTAVRVLIPEGMLAVKPMPKPGWTLATRRASYAKSYDYFGKPLSEGVVEITWSGGQLADDHFDEFVFQGRLAADLLPGAVLHLPTTQDCTTGKAAWTEIAMPGHDGHKLKHPAPSLTIIAGDRPIKPVKVGDLLIAAPWTREPPRGARVAGGFMSITNTGATPDRLIGGSAAFAKRVEVHEMTLDGSVMKMRELQNGLELKPGAAVELKPGGFHIMFMDVTEAPTSGRTERVKLRFERAGEVEIEMPVAPMAKSGGSHH